MAKTTRRLDREWKDHYAHSKEGTTALRRWQRTEPALRGIEDLDALLEARRDPARAYDILAPLGRRAPYDLIAARTLFQALLPGLVALGLHTFKREKGAFEEIVGLAWIRIRTYPRSRTGSVAGNVVLDVRKDYIAARAAAAPQEELLSATPTRGFSSPPAEETALTSRIYEELAEAFAAGVVDERDLDVLVRTRTGMATLEEVAADHETTPRYAQCVRWRAEQRLRHHLEPAA